MRIQRVVHFCAPLLIAGTAALSGCSSLDLASHWRKQEFAANPKDSQWQLTTLDDKLTSVGIMNDSSYLYVRLVSGNRGLERLIMRRGITFWFDKEGGKGKTFGIQYPVGSEDPGAFGGETGGSGEETGSRHNSGPGAAGELELYGPREQDHRRMSVAEAVGIEVHTRVTEGDLVYEMKVPLKEDDHHAFAIGTSAGTLIGVGMETARVRPEGQGAPEGRMGGRGGGRGFGGRGGRAGGGGGMARSLGQNQTEPLDLWAKVQLAKGDYPR